MSAGRFSAGFRVQLALDNPGLRGAWLFLPFVLAAAVAGGLAPFRYQRMWRGGSGTAQAVRWKSKSVDNFVAGTRGKRPHQVLVDIIRDHPHAAVAQQEVPAGTVQTPIVQHVAVVVQIARAI